MNHLEFERLLAVFAGESTAAENEHLKACAACRESLDRWNQQVAEIRELEVNELEPSELHRLQTLYRQLGPAPAGASWIARLIRSSEPEAAPVAIRGSLSSSLEAYRAGPWEIVVQVRPTGVEDRFELQGQVVGDADAAPAGSEVVLLSDRGLVDHTRLDAFGEFRFFEVPPGPYRAVWLLENDMIEVESIAVGVSGDATGE